MGKKASKRNSTLYKTQLQTASDQYTQSQAPQPMVYSQATTQRYDVNSEIQASLAAPYTPNSAQDSMEYHLPIPQNQALYKIEDSPQQEMDTGPDLLQISQVKASGNFARTPGSPESYTFFG